MRLTTPTLLGLLALAALGCGSGNSFHGTVNGTSLTPEGAGFGEVYFAPPSPTGGSPGPGHLTLNVTLSSDGAQTCPSTATSTTPVTQLFLLVQTREASGAFVAPGTGSYPVVAYEDSSATTASSFAVVIFDKQGTVTYGASGTVRLDSLQLVTGGKSTGSFDVVMEASAGTISGTFDADNCVTAAQ